MTDPTELVATLRQVAKYHWRAEESSWVAVRPPLGGGNDDAYNAITLDSEFLNAVADHIESLADRCDYWYYKAIKAVVLGLPNGYVVECWRRGTSAHVWDSVDADDMNSGKFHPLYRRETP